MAYVLTYQTLFESILVNTNHQDDPFLVSLIPEIIKKSESEISRSCQSLLEQESFVYGSLITNQVPGGPPGVIAKPVNWMSANYFFIGTSANPNDFDAERKELLFVVGDVARLYWPNNSIAAFPKFYSDYGSNNWIVTPAPDEDYPFEVSYKNTITPLDEDNNQNWITLRAPDIMENLCIYNTWLALKDTQKATVWRAAYNEGLQSLLNVQVMRNTDREQLRKKE